MTVVVKERITLTEGRNTEYVEVKATSPPTFLCVHPKIKPGDKCNITIVATTEVKPDDQKCYQGKQFPQVVVGYEQKMTREDRVDCGIIITEENWETTFKLSLKVSEE